MRPIALWFFPVAWGALITSLANHSEHGFWMYFDIVGVLTLPLSWASYYFDERKP